MSEHHSTTELSPGLRNCLSEFEAAVRERAFKGARDPSDVDTIERYYNSRKQQLLRKLLRLEAKPAGIELSFNERRVLVLAMGIVSLHAMIQEVDDDVLVGKMETQVDDAKGEFDALLDIVNQPELVEKLSPEKPA